MPLAVKQSTRSCNSCRAPLLADSRRCRWLHLPLTSKLAKIYGTGHGIVDLWNRHDWKAPHTHKIVQNNMPTLSYATSYLTSVKRCSKGEGTAGLFGHFGLYAVNNRQMLTASVEYTDKQHYGCTKLPQSGTQGSNGSSHPWHSVCVYIQQSFTSTAVKNHTKHKSSNRF